MNRRSFLASAGLTAATTAIGKASNPYPHLQQSRPNILVIMTDQQSANMMSIAGNPDLHTPAMDSIARRGVRFEKAYCTNPICVPSRTSFLTGTMPHENGVNFNTSDKSIGVKAPPLSNLLKKSGYRTGYVGKWHIPHDSNDLSWHGFDYVAHNKNSGIDSLIPNACATFLNEESIKPFFLFASFINPHDICEAARVLSGMDDQFYNGPIPEFPSIEHCPELPSNYAIPEHEPSVIRANKNDPKNKRIYPSRDWTEEQWRHYRWAYARFTELVDHEIGKLLELLRIHKVEDNTVIIFTSDHGDGNGAHQWNQKTIFYDECARIPFIIADPKTADPNGGSVDQDRLMSLGLDLFPTIFDYAGITIPKHLRGLSARPGINRKTDVAHEFLVSENDLSYEYGKSGGIYGRMIRTKQFKYVCYSEGSDHEQLFDMENDPGELNDLAQHPDYEHIIRKHRKHLRDYIKQSGDFFPVSAIAG